MASGWQKVDAATVQAGVAAGTLTLVDVRQPHEFAPSHIPGAVNLPLSDFDPQAVPREAGKQLVIYCKSGMRANDACQRLVKAGFDGVTCFEGGMSDWERSGFATEGSSAAAAVPGAQPVSCCGLSVQRQTQMVIGGMVVLFTLLGKFVHPGLGWLTLIPGLGLLNAGATGLCPLATGVAKLPWNR